MTVMEIKKPQSTQATATTSRETSISTAKKAEDYVGEIKAEIQKISWTSKEELRVYTTIVVVATFAFGLGIYLIDLVIQTVLSSVAAIIHLMGG